MKETRKLFSKKKYLLKDWDKKNENIKKQLVERTNNDDRRVDQLK